MELPLELVDKYFATWVDFLGLGPRKFREAVDRQPDKYLSAPQYFFGTLTLLSAALFAIAHLMNTDALKRFREVVPIGNSGPEVYVTVRILVYIAFGAFSVFGSAIALRWPLRSRASIGDIFRSLFYSSGLLLLIAGIDGVAAAALATVLNSGANGAAAFVFLFGSAVEGLASMVVAAYEGFAFAAFTNICLARRIEGLLMLNALRGWILTLIMTYAMSTAYNVNNYFKSRPEIDITPMAVIGVATGNCIALTMVLAIPALLIAWWIKRRLRVVLKVDCSPVPNAVGEPVVS